jgi:hypothetical protein
VKEAKEAEEKTSQGWKLGGFSFSDSKLKIKRIAETRPRDRREKQRRYRPGTRRRREFSRINAGT